MRLAKTDPIKNLHRFYEVDVQPNLFGGYSLMRYWGRIGTRGQIKIELHDDEKTAKLSYKKVYRSKIHRGYKSSNQNSNSP